MFIDCAFLLKFAKFIDKKDFSNWQQRILLLRCENQDWCFTDSCIITTEHPFGTLGIIEIVVLPLITLL